MNRNVETLAYFIDGPWENQVRVFQEFKQIIEVPVMEPLILFREPPMLPDAKVPIKVVRYFYKHRITTTPNILIYQLEKEK